MFEEWKVLHLDEVEAESILFCRALSQVEFAGHCESVRSFDEAKAYLERTLFTPQSLSRPDIVVINWHPDCDLHVLDFAHWIRAQPQFQGTPIIVFITVQLPLVVQQRAQYEGVTELLVRPDTFEALVDQVREVLERCVSRCVVR